MSFPRCLPASVAYFVAASLSIGLTRYEGGVAYLWLPGAIMVAQLVLSRRFEWRDQVIGFAIANSLATGLFGVGWDAAVPFLLGNMGEGLIGAVLLRRAQRIRAPLGSISWLMKFVIPIGLVAPAYCALVFAALSPLFGLDPMSSLIHVFTGHALANITFTPLGILIARGGIGDFRGDWRTGVRSEGFRLTLLAAIVTVGSFVQTSLPLLFVPFLPVILVAFRLGIAGTAVTVGLVAVISGTLTLLGRGPVQLIGAPLGEQLQFLQFYLACMVTTALPVAADLRNRTALLRTMRLSEERYRLLAEHSTDILMHLEIDGRIRYVSPSIHHIGGYQSDALIGQNATILVDEQHVSQVRREHRSTIDAGGQTRSYEYLAITKTGERRWFETHGRAIIDEVGALDGLLCVVRDISVRKQTEERLSHAALTDTLTGLPNRRSFEEAVGRRDQAPASTVGDCLAVFDIDRFKRVNDTFGHDAGDAVLKTFADVLRRVVRQGDVLARLGGEEFAVLFPATAVPQTLRICDRLRREIAVAVTAIHDDNITVTVSGGVALLGRRGIEAALKRADQALYAAKRGGRDQMALAA